MHIGLVIPSLHAGGAEHVARQWITKLAEAHGCRWTAYLYGSDLDPEQTRGLPIERRAYERASAVPHTDFVRWLRQGVANDKPDVLLGMLTYSNLAAVLATRLQSAGSRPAVVISERNVPTTYMPLEGASGRAQLALARRIYRYADGGVAISHPVAADMLALGTPARTLAVVPNPTLETTGSRKRKGPRESEVLRVLFVGRIVDQKRPQLFVDSLSEMKRRGIATVGWVVGDGPLREAMRDAGRRAGVALEFHGWVEDWREIGRHADVLLLPSSVEGFGNVYVEAAQLGLPSVACSSALGVADAIVPGITGQLVADDPTEIASGVEAAASLDLSSPVVDGWLSRFTADKSAAALHRHLLKIANRA